MTKENQPQWIYRGLKVPEEYQPESWAVGYIYRIIVEYANPDGDGGVSKQYIGKKILQTTRRKRIGVREKAATKTRKTFKVEKKDSNWQNYYGSCKELLNDLETKPEVECYREIIEWCYSKKNMTYLELKYQFLENVLERDTYNSNINGSLYKHDTSRKLYEEYKERQKTVVRKPRKKKEILF